jgi:multimeric flavodoxin WrbA
MARPHLLIINAGLAGSGGNTAVYLEQLRRAVGRRATVAEAVLADGFSFPALVPELKRANAFVFGTGTHWDSWSSLLQKFLEEATPSEGTQLWLGKPAGCLVTEHSVGGKDVLARLQGVLVTFGCLIPPMSGIVLSRVAKVAGQSDPQAAEDFWCPADLNVVAHNVTEAAKGGQKWKTWPVDRADFDARWA